MSRTYKSPLSPSVSKPQASSRCSLSLTTAISAAYVSLCCSFCGHSTTGNVQLSASLSLRCTTLTGHHTNNAEHTQDIHTPCTQYVRQNAPNSIPLSRCKC
ncbi:unnamed protein product [Ilex paraguariensis]|uniref:Uncharacterized protein n=1 Tax=Ilex paraguariensis TaxID=185542 RepID=A0ABC8S4Q7_9AQUA